MACRRRAMAVEWGFRREYRYWSWRGFSCLWKWRSRSCIERTGDDACVGGRRCGVVFGAVGVLTGLGSVLCVWVVSRLTVDVNKQRLQFRRDSTSVHCEPTLQPITQDLSGRNLRCRYNTYLSRTICFLPLIAVADMPQFGPTSTPPPTLQSSKHCLVPA